uniref:Uncharacterized protein n=1 Tax=Anas platyrhynchos TaxID=8839 RepID=A0A8B9QVJ2_ANAPL
EPLRSPTCNWTLRVRCFRASLNILHMQLDTPGSLFLSKPKRIPSCHRRRVKNQAPGNALRDPFAHPKPASKTTDKSGPRKCVPSPFRPSKTAPKGRLWVQENSPGEPLRSSTCNWTLWVRFFRATLSISLAGMGED